MSVITVDCTFKYAAKKIPTKASAEDKEDVNEVLTILGFHSTLVLEI